MPTSSAVSANSSSIMNLLALLIMVLMTSKNATSAGEAITHSFGVVKTITSEEGDIIDCMDIYDQPAFKDPLLKKHKIMMNPLIISGKKHINNTRPSRIQQNWHKSGTCPQGTIPIARMAYDQKKTTVSFMQHLGTKVPRRSTEAAVASSINPEAYMGTHGVIDIWAPYTEPNDMSLHYILMGGAGYNGGGNYMNFFVSTGWRVDPFVYNGDLKPRIFVSFTNKSETGCYNLGCGFIQTNNHIAIDAGISTTSTYNGSAMAITFSIAVEPIISVWRVYVGDEELGYYPYEVTQGFSVGDIAQWGGIVYSSGQGCEHTTTQMGSGHFPGEGESRSGKISDIYILGVHGDRKVSPRMITEVTNPRCYDLQLLDREGHGAGSALYYGGPGGGDPNCPVSSSASSLSSFHVMVMRYALFAGSIALGLAINVM